MELMQIKIFTRVFPIKNGSIRVYGNSLLTNLCEIQIHVQPQPLRVPELVEPYIPPVIPKINSMFVAELSARYGTRPVTLYDNAFNYTGFTNHTEEYYDVAEYHGELLVSDWFHGTIDIFDLNGKLKGFVVPADKWTEWSGHDYGNGAIWQVAAGNGKIALVNNFTTGGIIPLVFSLPDFTFLYEIPLPAWATSAGGLCIKGDYIYVGWNQDIVGGYASIERYLLSDGSYDATPDDDPTLGVTIEALDANNLYLYATSPSAKRINVYSIVDGTLLAQFDTSLIIPGTAEPRGLAASDEDVLVSGFYYRNSCAGYPTYCPVDNVGIYRFDSDLNYIEVIGEHGYDLQQFHKPFGVELRRV